MSDLITVDAAAKKLGIGPHGVRHLIRKRRLKAKRFGRFYLIRKSDLAKIQYGTPGRPKQTGTT